MTRSRGVTNDEMRLECSTLGGVFRLRVIPSKRHSQDAVQSDPLLPISDRDTRWKAEVECGKLEEDGFRWRPMFGALERDPIASMFRPAKFLRLDAKILSEPSCGGHTSTDLESNGSRGGGLASALALLALDQPDQFLSLQERLRSVIPAVKRIRFNRVPVSRIETETVKMDNDCLTEHLKKGYFSEEIVLDLDGAANVPAHLASDGTILILGLLAVLLGPVPPKLVLVDNIDHNLHPKVQRKLFHCFVRSSRRTRIFRSSRRPTRPMSSMSSIPRRSGSPGPMRTG